jgi:hypothetical protein
MKKIWEKWCMVVKSHNSQLTYVDQEDEYSPKFVFLPILQFFVTLILFSIVDKGIYRPLLFSFYLFVPTLIIVLLSVYKLTYEFKKIKINERN